MCHAGEEALPPPRTASQRPLTSLTVLGQCSPEDWLESGGTVAASSEKPEGETCARFTIPKVEESSMPELSF
jgi:hypothetical protein